MRYIEQNYDKFLASERILLKDVIRHCVHELEDCSEIATTTKSAISCRQIASFKNFPHREFQFESRAVRMLEIDGQFWWVAKDVCDVLGYQNHRDAIKKHVDDEDKGVAFCDTLSGKQKMTVISESGLYSLILSSKLPEAKKFKRWVTMEVLPSLRHAGHYEMQSAPSRTSIPERKLAIRERHAEARKLEALAKNTRALATLAKQNGATLPPGFIEKVSEVVKQTIT